MAYEDWIWRENLGPFISILGSVVGYRVDDEDLGAVEAGIKATDQDASRWFTYSFAGLNRLELRIAQCVGGNEVMFRVESPISHEVLSPLFLVAQSYTMAPRLVKRGS